MPISSYLDRTSLVIDGLFIQQKIFHIIRIKNDLLLFISRAGKETELYLQHDRETIRVFKCFIFSSLFCDFIADNCKKITNLVSPLHAIFFLREIKTGDPIRVRWAHLARLGGQSDYRNRLILLTGAFSCIMRDLSYLDRLGTSQID